MYRSVSWKVVGRMCRVEGETGSGETNFRFQFF